MAVAVPELIAFLGLRFQMEKCVIKPRHESYWQGAGLNFMVCTPGFRGVMERNLFFALWSFLHLVDQTDESVDKSDKIYKVRHMLDRMFPLFRRYYSPSQQLSLDEGMIPIKNHLAIKDSYTIMDSYRPHSRASHRFHTFQMFVDELCLQLVGDYRTVVHCREARAHQSDLLQLQGVGQHHPKCSPADIGNNLCMLCCTKYNKYLKKHPATVYGNMPHKLRKTSFWCSTCHKYLCLRVESPCWSAYHTKV